MIVIYINCDKYHIIGAKIINNISRSPYKILPDEKNKKCNRVRVIKKTEEENVTKQNKSKKR